MKKNRGNKNKSQKKIDSLFFRGFLLTFIGFVLLSVVTQWNTYKDLLAEQASIQALITQEEERQLSFEEQNVYAISDKYIEEMARSQLGMIKPNEILFINRGQ